MERGAKAPRGPSVLWQPFISWFKRSSKKGGLRKTTRGLMLALFLCLLPSAAFAQTAGGTGTISGVVKDASGSAIAGATVTVASPALIEGNKAATTDSSGAYRIIDLRPGTYSVTFSAPGFAKLQREGLALTV